MAHHGVCNNSTQLITVAAEVQRKLAHTVGSVVLY